MMRQKRWAVALGLLAATLLLAGCPSRGPYHDPPPHRDAPRRGYTLPLQDALPHLAPRR